MRVSGLCGFALLNIYGTQGQKESVLNNYMLLFIQSYITELCLGGDGTSPLTPSPINPFILTPSFKIGEGVKGDVPSPKSDSFKYSTFKCLLLSPNAQYVAVRTTKVRALKSNV